MKEPSSKHDDGGVAPPPLEEQFPEEPPIEEYPPMELMEGEPCPEYPLRLVRIDDSIAVLHVVVSIYNNKFVDLDIKFHLKKYHILCIFLTIKGC